MDADDVQRHRLLVTGTVQGVGFRPHVHRLAVRLSLAGHVGNDSTGVCIEVEGPATSLAAFRRSLVEEAPPLARIDGVVAVGLPPHRVPGFTVETSTSSAGPVTTAPPDTAPCQDCMREVRDPQDRRYRYPFTTCTNCGPRFTIITALPYDRPATTMGGFPLCAPCEAEYHDPGDRRFHAQPIACPDCGPRVRLVTVDRSPTATSTTDAVLAAVQRLLADGAIVAVKGIGGFHLACRADDQTAVQRLRRRKHRPGKPFAVVVADLAAARRLADLTAAEAGLLASPANPIVLLRRRNDADLAKGVAPGSPLIGVMLPASPLHHLLLAAVPGTDVAVPGPLVLTSGNRAEEPLCTDDAEAQDRLAGIADAWLLHDRPIAVPCDDSVLRVTDGQVTFVRRSRGYVPTPIPLPFDGVPVLAVGGQLKVTACLTDGNRAVLSQHLGDMGSLPALQAFERTIDRFSAMHRVQPRRLAVDLHPGYATRGWAVAHAGDRPLVEVQHHHAHIAAAMAEHGLDGREPVLGIAFDGTGYGPDGTIWGGEALLADYDGYRRIAHLSTTPLPGGDAAIRHPRRVALSHLRTAGVAWDEDLPPVRETDPVERDVLALQLARGLNCVATSSAGRLFDAVASLLDVRHDVTYEAQAAIELEVLAGAAPAPADLVLPFDAVDAMAVLDAAGLIRQVVDGVRAQVPAGALALGFHHAIATALHATATWARERHGVQVVALSGGVFANALLATLTSASLQDAGFRVLRHQLVPPNDGGLALGQAVIAMAAGSGGSPPRSRPAPEETSVTAVAEA